MAFLRFCLVFSIVYFSGTLCRAQVVSSEYKVKAAFLLNFLKFVEWPSSVFPSTNSSYCIGVLGEDPFGEILDNTVRDKNIDGRPVEVKRGQKFTDLTRCHLVFISRSERARLRSILREARTSSTLLVSEIEGFASVGGTINFKVQNDKVRFEINPHAAKAAGLRMSSKLLSLATIISHEPNQENE